MFSLMLASGSRRLGSGRRDLRRAMVNLSEVETGRLRGRGQWRDIRDQTQPVQAVPSKNGPVTRFVDLPTGRRVGRDGASVRRV